MYFSGFKNSKKNLELYFPVFRVSPVHILDAYAMKFVLLSYHANSSATFIYVFKF